MRNGSSQNDKGLTFVQRVRNREVAHPTQRAFSEARWQKAFEDISTPDLEDLRLFHSGLWTFNKFEVIRSRLASSLLTGFSKYDLIRMYVAGANRGCQILAHKSKEVDDLVIAEQIVQAKVDRSPVLGGSADPEALLMSSVDALRFPIQKAYGDDSQKSGPTLDDLEVIGRLTLATLLAQVYNIVDGYWMHMLWNDWYLESSKDLDLVRPPEGIRPIISAVSNYRRSALMIETSFHFDREWRHLITDAGKSLLLRLLPRVEGNGDLQQWSIKSREEFDNGSHTLFLNKLRAERGYYSKLIHEPVPGIAPVTLHMLLSGWEVLYAIAERLLSNLPEISESGVYSVGKLITYAPVLKKKDVITLIKNWCDFSASVSETVVQFFCYGPGMKWELWGHPIVEIDNQNVLFLLAPILYGNMERTFELWMKDGKLDIGEKGFYFEEYARTELKEALTESPKLKDAEVYPQALLLKSGDQEEEIDIVIRIKNIIFLGEAKCILYPSDPIEVARYFEIISGATSQIKRKVRFAKDHLDKLVDELGLTSKGSASELVLCPFVLVNQPYAAGFPLNGVPIVDELIWKRFFEGEYHQMVRTTEEGQLRAKSILELYTDEADATTKASPYLKDPPQLFHYRQNIQTGVEKYPRIDDNDRYFAAAFLEVVLALPAFSF
jgi:hypothetical protein